MVKLRRPASLIAGNLVSKFVLCSRNSENNFQLLPVAIPTPGLLFGSPSEMGGILNRVRKRLDAVGYAQDLDKGFIAYKISDFATALGEWRPLAE